MPLTPPSTRPLFDGFSRTYAADIEPFLVDKEVHRQNAVTQFFAIMGATLAAVAAFLIFKPLGEGLEPLAIPLFMVGVAVSGSILSKAREDITHGLLQRVCEGLGVDYQPKIYRPLDSHAFEKLGLLPSFDEALWEDEIVGTHSGSKFWLCEAHLEKITRTKNGERRSTVFHGQLITIDYPKPFMGTTVLRRDAGPMNRFTRPGSEFQHVGLASSKFERAFEAWSTDQVEARDLLDPVVLERFQELERLFQGKRLRAAFVNGKAIIAMETGDRLNMGSMFKRLDDPRRVEIMLKEFDMIFDLIDMLITRVERPLEGAVSIADLRGGAD